VKNLTSCGKLVETTGSVDETFQLGKKIAAEALKKNTNIFLWGELGAGKTTFLKGVGLGLGITENIVSPTFQLVRKYEGTMGRFIHIDLYRLSDTEEIMYLGWEELLREEAVTAVEWAGRAKDILPEEGLFVMITVISKEERKFEICTKKKNIPWN